MLIQIRELCGALDRATLTGNQEDWGEHSQRLFNLYRSLIKRVGDQVVHLGGETANDVVATIRSIDLLPEETECLHILQKSLTTPARPFTCLVTLEAISA